MKVKTMTRMALLSAIALTIFWVEAQIPMPIPVPGVKLGLANVVTVYAVFSLGAGGGGILLVRVLLGSLFSRSNDEPAVFCCWGSAGASDRPGPEADFDRNRKSGIASCFSAVAHNLGQIAVAIAITRTPALLSYLPVLLVSGLLTGLFTGLAAQTLLQHLHKIGKPQIHASGCGENMSKM